MILRHLFVRSVLLAGFACCAFADDSSDELLVAEEGGVAVLTTDTFPKFVFPKDLVLVEFYAPWCGHCQQLKPEYSKAAKSLQGHGIPLAMVDATVEGALANDYLVQGYPTLILFRRGVKQEVYQGPRDARAIIEYMLKNHDPDWVPPPSEVVPLSRDNFTDFVKHENVVLVEFYSPTCKHCKQLEPELESAAREVRDIGIRVAKVDATIEKDLAADFAVESFPTLKLFLRGRIYDYAGPREKDGIVGTLKQWSRPASEEKRRELEVNFGMDGSDATVVGFFSGENAFFREYEVAANLMRGTFKFMHSFDPAVSSAFDVAPDTVVVFQPETLTSSEQGEKTRSMLSSKDGDKSYKDVVRFVREKSVPLAGHRTKRNLFKFGDRPLVVVYYDVNFEHFYEKDTQFVRRQVAEVAKSFEGSPITFAISNDEEFEDEVKSLGFDPFTEIKVALLTEKQKFRLDSATEFSAAALKQFVEDVKGGKVKPHMKSQTPAEAAAAAEEEEENEDEAEKGKSAVMTLIADRYDEDIHRVDKDAVLFFHAPWCSHCQEFDPIYKKLAKKMTASSPRLTFAKMDATANDAPYFFPAVQGFPTLFFVPARDKFFPVKFHGDRNAKDVRAWVKSHATNFTLAGDDGAAFESFTKELFDGDFARLGAAEGTAGAKDEL